MGRCDASLSCFARFSSPQFASAASCESRRVASSASGSAARGGRAPLHGLDASRSTTPAVLAECRGAKFCFSRAPLVKGTASKDYTWVSAGLLCTSAGLIFENGCIPSLGARIFQQNISTHPATRRRYQKLRLLSRVSSHVSSINKISHMALVGSSHEISISTSDTASDFREVENEACR